MPEGTAPAGHRQDFVTVAGCKTLVLRGGKGRTILYLHGASGGGVWQPFMQDLAKRYEVIAPEHPGFGQTDTPDWLDRMEDLAYFYLDFMKQQDLRDVHLIGSSFGGWLAAEIAVRSTQRISSLTLIGAAGLRPRGVEAPDTFLWKPEEAVRNTFSDPKMVEAALARQPSEEEMDRQLKNRFTLAKLGWHPRMHNPDLPKWIHRIDVPTLVMWGADDKIVPPVLGDYYAKMIPGAKLQTIGNCGHLPQVERRDEFVAAVTGFLDGK